MVIHNLYEEPIRSKMKCLCSLLRLHTEYPWTTFQNIKESLFIDRFIAYSALTFQIQNVLNSLPSFMRYLGPFPTLVPSQKR